METIICDITAFDYWRIPPIVQLLLAGDETNPALTKLIREEQILLLREEMKNEPLCKLLLKPSPATRKSGHTAKSLEPLIPLLSANHLGAIDVMVDRHNKCYSSSLIRSHLFSGDLPIGASIPVSEYIRVTSPAHTLLKLSGCISFEKTLMLATELCGSFTIYKAPKPIKIALQQLSRNRAFPAIGGWKPFFDGTGNLTDLWSRPALTTPQELQRISDGSNPQRGLERFRTAAHLVAPDAASPFEARAGILLGLSRRRGGEGHAGFTFNKRIDLTEKAKSLAHRNYCVCDLYWDNGLDVECQSALAHDNAASFLSDSDRTAALRNMGVDVLPITFDQLRDQRRFAAFSETVAKIRGKRIRPKTPRQIDSAKALRNELFADWATIHLH